MGQESNMTTTTWKCLRCEDVKAKTTRENEPFNDLLPGVVLLDVEVTKCMTCGNREVEVPYMDDLMKAVARAVVQLGGRMTGDEVRFLRTFLELSGVELAELMDSTPGTVSRWENNRTPVGRTADLLLRTIARGEAGPTDPDHRSMLEFVRGVKLDEPRRSTVYPFRLAGTHWELAKLSAAVGTSAAAKRGAAPARTRRSASLPARAPSRSTTKRSRG
jgi:putative zinc finger/helix-turn-helix YgiT family protein